MNEKLTGVNSIEIGENDPTPNEDNAIEAQADTQRGGKPRRLMGAVGISNSGAEAIALARTPKRGAYTLEERFPGCTGEGPENGISAYDLDADRQW